MQYCSICYVLDIFTSHEKRLAYGFIVILFAVVLFEQDKAYEYRRCTAYSQVTASPMKFLSEFQKRFAGFKQYSIDIWNIEISYYETRAF